MSKLIREFLNKQGVAELIEELCKLLTDPSSKSLWIMRLSRWRSSGSW